MPLEFQKTVRPISRILYYKIAVFPSVVPTFLFINTTKILNKQIGYGRTVTNAKGTLSRYGKKIAILVTTSRSRIRYFLTP